MIRAILAAALLCVASSMARAESAVPAAPQHGSVFAFPLVGGTDRPDLVLAQRTIERRWGPSEDSVYREVSVPGWKSEGGAMAMSAVLPGAGQIYAGEHRMGYAFLLAEAVGFYQHWALQRTADRFERKARAYAGNPQDSTSRWAFSTYEQRTGQSADALRALYQADPDLFYYEIARYDNLQQGWSDYGYTEIEREQFIEWRENVEERRKRARYFVAMIWANHVIAAVDALREARISNLPLRRDLELHLKSGWSRGAPQMAVSLERRF